MKKLVVDSSVCIGCGACVGIDNKHFDFDDSGLSTVVSQDNLDDENINEAIASCPVSAISLVQDSCNCNNCQCDDCDCDDDCNCGSDCGDDCNCGSDCECHKKAA